jgi:hypothetical protein
LLSLCRILSLQGLHRILSLQGLHRISCF